MMAGRRKGAPEQPRATRAAPAAAAAGHYALDMAKVQALVVTIEHGSVLAASRAAGIARSTLRRQLEELEQQIGEALLTKKDGKVVPTKAGRVVFERGKALLAGCTGLVREARQAGDHLGRRIQIALPPGLPLSVLTMCAQLQDRLVEPARLRVVEDPLRALEDGVDIALHVGKAPPEGPWVSIALMPMRRVLIAGAEYARRRGLPARVEDLAEHALFCWQTAGLPPPLTLPLRDGGSVAIEPQVICNDETVVRELAMRGEGIAFMPDAEMMIPEKQGQVYVLADTVGDDIALHAIVPNELSDLRHPAGIVSVVRAGLAAPFPGDPSG